MYTTEVQFRWLIIYYTSAWNKRRKSQHELAAGVLHARAYTRSRTLHIVPTFHKRSGKSSLLNRTVRQEFDVQLIRSRVHVQGQFISAILVYQRAVGWVSVSDLHVVVKTIVVVFDLRKHNIRICAVCYVRGRGQTHKPYDAVDRRREINRRRRTTYRSDYNSHWVWRGRNRFRPDANVPQ